MLLWQWKSVHKKAIIWGHLVSIALVLHIFFGYIFFSWIRHGVQHVILTMQRDVSKIPVVFTRSPLATQAMTHTVFAPGVSTQSVVKTVPRSSLKTAITQPKSNKPKVAKKTPPKKVAEKKVSAKKEIKKETPPKKELPVKKDEPKRIEKKSAPILEKVLEAPLVPIPVTTQSNIEQITAPLVQENNLSGINNEEAELYALVAQQWAPPAGIAAIHECEVSAKIGWNQEIHKVWVSKKSGILMYDLAARKAVMQTKFPLWTRGKTVTIRFVQ